ncbi:MAG: DsrE family protein [Leptospira sp.]|nr:DsrE family protein [Leptospira sp.]
MKTTIAIFSDPKSGSEESLGRLLNALAAAYDFKNAGEEVSILFQGAGTRWPEVLEKDDHPAHGLFNAVKDKILGVSSGCAELFGAKPTGLDLIKTNLVPGTSGLPSFLNLQKQGDHVLVF